MSGSSISIFVINRVEVPINTTSTKSKEVGTRILSILFNNISSAAVGYGICAFSEFSLGTILEEREPFPEAGRGKIEARSEGFDLAVEWGSGSSWRLSIRARHCSS